MSSPWIELGDLEQGVDGGASTTPLLPTNPKADISSEAEPILLWHDGDAALPFTDHDALRNHLRLYPEAENDQATRLFCYTRSCPPKLMFALLEKFPFVQFAMIPCGITTVANKNGGKIYTCKCPECSSSTSCGHAALDFGISFWRSDEESLDMENQLKITANDRSFTLYARGRAVSYSLENWCLQMFRFPSRRIEHTDRARDAMICRTRFGPDALSSSPVGYIVMLMQQLCENWVAIIRDGRQFLACFSVEVLSERLETDRTIIQNLVSAAQLWLALQRLLILHVNSLCMITEAKDNDFWLEGAEDVESTKAEFNGWLARLKSCYQDLDEGLIRSTDSLIQRVTNLISIHEGYRSRDTNASIRRLSWITFIFLPLIFGAGVFGMNVDLLAHNPSWVYYIAFTIPLSFIVGLIYSTMRYCARKRPEKTARSTPGGRATETSLTSDTVLSWAAATGQVDTISSLLHFASGAQATSTNRDPLLEALRNGHQQAACMLIANPTTSLDTKDSSRATALHYACMNGFQSVVEMLLSRGAYTAEKDSADMSPLDYAVKGKLEGITAMLLHLHYTGHYDSMSDTSSAAHVAATRGDTTMLRGLAAAGFSLTSRDALGRTAVFSALESADVECLEYLISQPQDLGITDYQGLTLLHEAVILNEPQAVEILLRAGISTNSRASHSLKTPLFFLDTSGTSAASRILQLLSEHQVDMQATDSSNQTILHILAASNDNCADLFNNIVSLGGNPSAMDDDGNTPLHIIATTGNEELLLAVYPCLQNSIRVRNNNALTPMDVMADHGFEKMLRRLVPDFATTASSARLRLLKAAALNDDMAMVKSFQEQGAQLEKDKTLLALYVMNNAEQCTKYLIDIGIDVRGTTTQGAQTKIVDGQTWFVDTFDLLYKAIMAGCSRTIPLLIEAGFRLNFLGLGTWSCFHAVAFMNDIDTALLLRARALDSDMKDSQGWTAHDLAYHYKHMSVAELLTPEEGHIYPWTKEDSTRGYTPGCDYSTPTGLVGEVELDTPRFGRS